MRLLTWNLNHRAARRRIPTWVSAAVAGARPDVAVLTEYVVGPDHQAFVDALSASGLRCISVSERVGRENQLLIATRETHSAQPLEDPQIHRSLPSNIMQVRLDRSGVTVLGLRMPAYSGHDVPCKRQTWDWIHSLASRLESVPAIITGDLNTAFGDAVSHCGDRLGDLATAGWQCASPDGGSSWRHPRTGTGRAIDHLFLSSSMSATHSVYSWDFEGLSGSATGTVGLPDHAMLVATVDTNAAR